jgi:hypothetical protein
MRRALLPLLLLLALTAACGGDDGEEDVVATATTADPDSPVSSPPGTDTGTVPATTWTRIEPTEDLTDAVVATPDELVPDPDDPNAVLVRFYGGVQPCYGARTTVVESDSEVTVTLEVGSNPAGAGQACIEIAEAQELQVVLDAPLGDRELVAETGDR